ncbi:hypothetical protein ANO11243_069280 [Dothideomycetidae sp. 11243]|nr:hypothetical protein ANO11243_069280 [fungal sp. No.11243]
MVREYFESHLSPLLANVFPRITARRSFQARETVYRAMLKYARAGGYADEDCSELAKSRWQTQTDAGATEENIARLETAVNVGVLSNTVPSTFWTIFEVLSDPDLLEAVRAEIRSNAMEVDPATKVHAIDLSRIRAGCPTLVSAFQEVLRVHSNGAPTRMVYEDILLDDRYLLKAGSVLQLPAPAINGDGSQWGSDPKKFDHTRFQAREQQINARGTVHLKPRATSYMSFGASPNLCPGRHFAAAEILSLVAMLVMRVDITPTKGEWWVPRLNSWAVAASMTPPVEDYPVLIRQRPEYEGVEWTFTVSGFKDKFELITG